MKTIRQILVVLLLTVGVASPIRAELKPYPLDTIQGEVVYRYTAEKSIGLYRISVNFGCSQADIIRLNPQLKERGLHLDEVIYIPAPAEDLVDVQRDNEDVQRDNEDVQRDNVQSTKDVPSIADVPSMDSLALSEPGERLGERVPQSGGKGASLNLALLLPLQAEALERNVQMDRFVDFYEGALLAIYDVQQNGQTIDLKVYDTNKSVSELQSILHSGQLNDRQMVIGPAYPALVEPAGMWAKYHQIPMVIPFTGQVNGIEENPYLIQFNTTASIEADSLAAQLRRENTRVIFVEAREADMPESVRQLRRAVLAAGVDTAMTTVHAILNDSLHTAIRGTQRHLLVLNTEKYQNISILLPAIERAAERYPLMLLTHYSWPTERLRMPYCYTSVFATDTPADTQHYEALYQRFFGHTHASLRPRYDLLGYDLTRWALARLMGTEYFGLQSDIRMEKMSETGGWRNTYIRVVEK